MPSVVFAADLGGTKLSAALVDVRGKILARRTELVDLTSTGAPLEQICHMARLLAAASRQVMRLRAAGVAVPGLVRRDGRVWAPNLPGWKRVPLAKLLRRKLGVPVVVESDRNAAVIAEGWRGAGRGKTDILVLLVGTGIGAGIISGGRLVRGAHELSGCAGWMVVTERQEPGFLRVGCLEALAAGPGVARAAGQALKRKRNQALSAQDVAQAARRGDRHAQKLFERVGTFLGFAVANLISLFDPEVVILGGGIAEAGDLFFGRLKRVALERCQPLAGRQVRIVRSRLGENANLFGMARLAWLAARSAR